MGMEKASLNSLNSKRNLKLPPIQGAVPSEIYRGPKTWHTSNGNKSITHVRHNRAHVQKQVIDATHFHSINRVDLNAAVEFPRQKRVISSPRKHIPVQISLGHEFPKTYTVLPPINHKSVPTHPREQAIKRNARKGIIDTKREEKHGKIEPQPPRKPSTSRRADGLSAKRLRKVTDKIRQPESDKSRAHIESIAKLGQTGVTTSSENVQETKPQQHEIEEPPTEKIVVPRKFSPVYKEHLKCKRFGRRNGVCKENESTLNNVTDQLKDIFLRRNMEEMYLI